MLKINLAPQKLKEELKMRTISKSVNKLITLLSVYFVFCTLFLYATAFYMNMHYKQNENIINVVSKDTESYTKKLINIKKSTDFISSIQKDYTKWSSLFYSIGLTVNQGLSINTIEIDKDKNILTLSLHADTRDSLLAFKKNIETNEYLSDIEFPIKTLFEKADIDFSLNANISSYEFNQL